MESDRKAFCPVWWVYSASFSCAVPGTGWGDAGFYQDLDWRMGEARDQRCLWSSDDTGRPTLRVNRQEGQYTGRLEVEQLSWSRGRLSSGIWKQH